MLKLALFTTASLLCLKATTLARQLACNDEIPLPEYFGTKVTALTAREARDWENWGPAGPRMGLPFDRKKISFCNVTISYTHPGQGDSVNVYVWLPLDGWNGNFLGQGGGGLAAGSEGALAPAIARGYAAANTDAGRTFFGNPMQMVASAENWALKSPGNVDWQLLNNFGSISLDDMTHIGKQVVASFYGNEPKYSYWHGCSTGGRQGLMQAQRYPTNYDGILAAAPAINWQTFVPAGIWGQVLMKRENSFPPACEFQAITKAAIEACDDLDGVKDAVIAAPNLCKFNAESIVGTQFDCQGEKRKVSAAAARIANGMWEGLRREDQQWWYGLNHETALAVQEGLLGGLLQTSCDEQNKNCKGVPMPIGADWIRLFLARDPDYDIETMMSEEDFFDWLYRSKQEYTSSMGTDDPDLSRFAAAGGKMITWHGLADQLIFPNGSSSYYDRVLQINPEAKDFYRYFEAPGVAHCMGGPGAFPATVFDELVAWVEQGKAPDELAASTAPMNEAEAVRYRPLCLYPQVAAYQGGDPDLASSFKCADRFGKKKAPLPDHSEL